MTGIDNLNLIFKACYGAWGYFLLIYYSIDTFQMGLFRIIVVCFRTYFSYSPVSNLRPVLPANRSRELN